MITLWQEHLPIGALFRRFNTLPTFTLHSAGSFPGGFFRQYQLKVSRGIEPS